MFKDEGEKNPTRENALQIYAGNLTNQEQNPLALVLGTSNLKDLEEAREALQKRETEIRSMVLARFHQCWWREDLREETSYNAIVPNMIQMFSVVREEKSKKPTYVEGTYLYTKLAPSNYSSFLGACSPAMRALGLGKTVEEIASINLTWQEKGPAMPDIPILGVAGVFGRVTHLSGKFFMDIHNDGPSMNFGVAFSEDALRRIILCRPLFTPR